MGADSVGGGVDGGGQCRPGVGIGFLAEDDELVGIAGDGLQVGVGVGDAEGKVRGKLGDGLPLRVIDRDIHDMAH